MTPNRFSDYCDLVVCVPPKTYFHLKPSFSHFIAFELSGDIQKDIILEENNNIVKGVLSRNYNYDTCKQKLRCILL